MATEILVSTSMPDIDETVPDDIVLPGVQDEGIIVQGPDEVIETEPLTSTVDASVVVQDLDHFAHTPNSTGSGTLAEVVLTTPRALGRLPVDDLDEDEEISNDEEEDTFISSSDDDMQEVIVDDVTQMDDDDYIVDEDDVYDDDDYIEEDESAPFKPRRKGHGRRISATLKRKPQGMYKCSECYKAFALFENLQKHSRLHTAESPFACQICRKPFTKPSALERHMRTHTGERPYSCDSCGKGFTRRSHLQRHVKLHYSAKPFRCSECRSAFTSEEALYEHKTIHVSQTTSSQQRGGQSAPSMEFLAQAALLAGAELMNGQPAEGARSQLAYNARQMEVLMTQQTREQAAEASGGIMLAEGKYKCRKCAKTFAKLGSLEKHAILHTDQSPFKCQYCHRGFPKPSILKRHMGVHLREQDIAVRRRPHSYMSATSRRRQARNIEEEEPEQEVYGDQLGEGWEGEVGRKRYKCDQCWQSFVFEENLERHQLRHTEASPYKCSTCNRPFTKQSKLLRHEKTHQIASGSSHEVDSSDLLHEELAEVPKDINDDVQAILAASSRAKSRQSKKKGHRHRSGGGAGNPHKGRRGKKRKLLVPRTTERRLVKRHKGHMSLTESEIDILPGHQITPVDTSDKSPVGALHITSVDSVEVPLPSAAPPEQLMDSPLPRPDEEILLTLEEVVEAPVETDDVGPSGEMVVQHGEVVVEADDHIEETPTEHTEKILVTTVADDILDTTTTTVTAGDHTTFSTEFTDGHTSDEGNLITVAAIESDASVVS